MNPTPPPTPSIAELRTSLLELSEQLTVLERMLARAESPTRRTRSMLGLQQSSAEREERLNALNVRLALISELVSAMEDGAALVTPEQQLLGLLLASHLNRVKALVRELPAEAPSAAAIEAAQLPIDLPPPRGA